MKLQEAAAIVREQAKADEDRTRQARVADARREVDESFEYFLDCILPYLDADQLTRLEERTRQERPA